MVFIQDEGPQDAAYAATGGMFQTQDGGQGKEERARTKNREVSRISLLSESISSTSLNDNGVY